MKFLKKVTSAVRRATAAVDPTSRSTVLGKVVGPVVRPAVGRTLVAATGGLSLVAGPQQTRAWSKSSLASDAKVGMGFVTGGYAGAAAAAASDVVGAYAAERRVAAPSLGSLTGGQGAGVTMLRDEPAAAVPASASSFAPAVVASGGGGGGAAPARVFGPALATAGGAAPAAPVATSARPWPIFAVLALAAAALAFVFRRR